MSFISILSTVGIYIWDSFKLWLHTIFIAPGGNFDMFWVLIPIYIGWIFADFFQEKRGTSLGNAISNGVIALWAGVDWVRTVMREVSANSKVSWTAYMGQFLLCFFVFIYGLWIIYEGIKGKALTKYIGRIREVTYVLIIFTPVIYGVTKLTFPLIFGTVVFFPLFYYFVELLDYIIPDPKSIEEDGGRFSSDNGKSSKSSSDDMFGPSSGSSSSFGNSNSFASSKGNNNSSFGNSSSDPFGGKDDFKF